MMIIGCDFHTRYQQIARMDEAIRELVAHRAGRADKSDRPLQEQCGRVEHP